MSAETSKWLNQNTLIGFTEKRGTAWHYRASDQGEESNHYDGAIPVKDVERRLFHWTPVEVTARFVGEYEGPDGELQEINVVDNSRKGIVRSDTGEVLGVFKSGYKVHGYSDTLIKSLENILDQGLEIGSAGLLQGGAVAWVQAEMPDTIEMPEEGVSFRPFINAATSLNGTLSSTLWTGSQLVVCDNTLSAALGDKSKMIKIKHSKNSLPRVETLRDALGIVFKIGEDFAAQVKQLCKIEVSDKAWQAFVEEHTELSKRETPAAITRAENKIAALTELWNNDNRVSPWRGTAFGVIQAVNTYAHHKANGGNERAERNMLRVVKGEIDDLDGSTLATLEKVLASV